MAKLGPGVVVGGLTLAAMAAIGVLAVQAQGAETKAAAARAKASATASPSPSASPTPTVPALPGSSGTGRRVVYSIGSHQVWLVDPAKNPQVVAVFPVTPGSMEPAVGNYTVYSRSASGVGTDGKQVEHAVRFAKQNGTVFGFSATVDGSTSTPDGRNKSGGIRASHADGQTLWDFAPNGTRVYVVA